MAPKKRSKSSAATTMDVASSSSSSDDSSVESDVTPKHKTKATFHRTTFHSFCQLTVKIPEAKRAIVAYRGALMTFYAELQAVDPEARLIEYKTDLKMDKKSQCYQIKLIKTIKNKSKLPNSITQLLKYFSGGKPSNKGGQVFSKVHFMHEESLDNILIDLKEIL